MCGVRGFDKRTRRIYIAGNLFLIAGLLLTVFAGGWGAHHRGLYDGVRGLCFGLAISFLFWSVRQRRRNCAAQKSAGA